MNILSVDDNAENRYYMEALLRSRGHAVDSVPDGKAALGMLAEKPYDAIVSDILMPKMDGFQLCREIKRDPALRDIPFLFYTATYTDSRDEALALSLGADRFLVKPLDPDRFLAEIESAAADKSRDRPRGETPPGPDETVYLAEYNARLVAKLETKLIELETVQAELRRDIEARQRAEEETGRLAQRLLHAQKMEAIGTLAGGIAHDFNNILAGIVGFADLIRHEADTLDAAREYAQEILHASQRARELIRQILAFSREQTPSRQPLKLQRPISDALKLMRASIPATTRIEIDLDPEAPAVLADPTQVHQIVANLVTNAWHALGDQHGTIRILLETLQVDPPLASSMPDLQVGRYVRLTVADDGCGMEPGILKQIFDPFFTTKQQGIGTGLGLATVHGIVRSWDGAIGVRSEPGRGSAFEIYCPAIGLDASPEPLVATSIPRGNGERVLFIDDEPALAQVGERSLAQLGYRARSTTEPTEALHIFTAEPFDLVITDLTMPGTSGLDLGRQMLALRPGTRVLITTGYSATLDETRARELGFAGLLLKPYHLSALAEATRQAIPPQSGQP